MARALKEKVVASVGLKLVVALTGVILVLMVLGTLYVARIMTADQYRHIERIKQIAKESANWAAGLNIAVETMAGRTGLLKTEMEKFRM